MLKVHEITRRDGALANVYLAIEDGQLLLVDPDESLPIPDGALAAVMARYGAPLEPSEPIHVVASLDVGGGRFVRSVRHLARFDVIARDYLVYAVPGAEPSCALSTTIVAALSHLGRAARDARPPS